MIAVGETAESMHVVRATFEPGAPTRWHRHKLGQVLIATAGIGRFQVAGGPLVELRPTDSMTVALGQIRWHGSATAKLFIHTSIQAADARGV